MISRHRTASVPIYGSLTLLQYLYCFACRSRPLGGCFAQWYTAPFELVLAPNLVGVDSVHILVDEIAGVSLYVGKDVLLSLEARDVVVGRKEGGLDAGARTSHRRDEF